MSSRQSVRHPSHNHPLRGHKCEAKDEIICSGCDLDLSTYTCNACGEYGSSFTYNCSTCQYDVHVGCVSMPETMKREDHAHPLTLVYGSPYNQPGLVSKCDVCEDIVPDNLWSYYCKECDYATHLHSCKKDEEAKKEEKGEGSKSSVNSELAAMLEAQREMERMQIEMHLAMQSALISKKANKAALNCI
ncbi:unnamed protein product [Arabidopsis halleri]